MSTLIGFEACSQVSTITTPHVSFDSLFGTHSIKDKEIYFIDAKPSQKDLLKTYVHHLQIDLNNLKATLNNTSIFDATDKRNNKIKQNSVTDSSNLFVLFTDIHNPSQAAYKSIIQKSVSISTLLILLFVLLYIFRYFIVLSQRYFQQSAILEIISHDKITFKELMALMSISKIDFKVPKQTEMEVATFLKSTEKSEMFCCCCCRYHSICNKANQTSS